MRGCPVLAVQSVLQSARLSHMRLVARLGTRRLVMCTRSRCRLDDHGVHGMEARQPRYTGRYPGCCPLQIPRLATQRVRQ